MDETTLTLHPTLRKCWMKRGQQLSVPAAGQQRLHHLFAAYDYVTGCVFWLDAAVKDSKAFLRFLEHLMRLVTSSLPIVLVLDNASYHHSAYSEAALAFFEDDGLIPCWLPPYCSDLNLIERFWLYLKGFACANKLFASVSALLDSVRRCLDAQNDFNPSDRLLFLPT